MRRVAIVGSGPSGCFTAQGILKARPGWQVDLIESLPVPYGLVRYGVAADHQGTKAVMRQFERLFERQGARFFGNVSVGRDVTLDDLRRVYDGVVLATGLAGDRDPGLTGGRAVRGMVGAGALTRALYDHPDAPPLPDIGGDVVILGNGNVAIDLLRLLAKTTEELENSDLGPDATDWLGRRRIDSLTIVGRSPAERAKFDAVMIRELSKLGNIRVEMDPLPAPQPDESRALDALRDLAGHADGALPVRFRFGCRPTGVEAQGAALRALMVEGPGGAERIACTWLLTAIGFQCDGSLGRDAHLAAATDPASGVIAPGLYAAGWFRRGPTGTIPENRAECLDLAQRIVADLEAAPGGDRPGIDAMALRGIVDHAGWKRVDAIETSRAIPGRTRTKIATRAEMMRHAQPPENL